MRTEEQIAADETLTAAIENVIVAYFGEQGDLVQEYVVSASVHGLTEDGEPTSGVTIVFRDGSVPASRALGLFEAAKHKLLFESEE